MKRETFILQAEDGIRDGHVTGVQTCALPIFRRRPVAAASGTADEPAPVDCSRAARSAASRCSRSSRSEERRVGKEGSSRGAGAQSEKKRGRQELAKRVCEEVWRMDTKDGATS